MLRISSRSIIVHPLRRCTTHTVVRSRSAMTRFFTPFDSSDSNPSEFKKAVKRIITTQPEFLPINKLYSNADVSLEVGEFSSAPPHTQISNMVEENYDTPPESGSMVEFYDISSPDPQMGVVVRDIQSKFNENYNKLVVLTEENQLRFVGARQITFHWRQVVDREWVEAADIMGNRFDDNFTSRLRLVAVIQQFAGQIGHIHRQLESTADIVHTQYARNHHMVSVGLVQVLESCQLPDNVLQMMWTSLWHQQVVLGALRLVLINSPKWIVPSVVTQGQLSSHSSTNIMIGQCSNELILRPQFYTNSFENVAAIDAVCQDVGDVDRINNFFRELEQKVVSLPAQEVPEQLNLHFNIWGGKPFRHWITALKWATVYPHPVLLEAVSKVASFPSASMSSILEYLQYKIKLYDNCIPTDYLLSANIIGKSKMDSLVVTLPSQVEAAAAFPDALGDKYQHLRQKRSNTIFVVKGDPRVAISLEKVNARNFVVNIHVPDIMSRLSPNSEEFEAMVSHGGSIKTINREYLDDILGSLDLQLEAQGEVSSEYFEVVTTDKPKESGVTCLTISLAYNSYDFNPFKDIASKVSVSFDNVDKSIIKEVDEQELDNCLLGKLEPSPFRLFRRGVVEQVKLTPEDCHDLRFIFNILKTHFTERNREGALTSNQAINTNVSNPHDINVNVDWTNATAKVTAPSNEPTHLRAQFLRDETAKLAGRMVSSFASRHGLAMVVENQSVLPEVVANDTVLVSHDNRMLPSYYTQSFYQTLISRDEHGYVSLPASVIGGNYLARRQLRVFPEADQRIGIASGYCPLTELSPSALINQLQLLYWVHNHRHGINNRKYAYLQGYGYRQQPMTPAILSDNLHRFTGGFHAIEAAGVAQKRQWMLRTIENDAHMATWQPTRMVLTWVGPYLDSIGVKLCLAVHPQLGIEVWVATAGDRLHTLGSVVVCDEVVYVDPSLGHCVMQEAEANLVL